MNKDSLFLAKIKNTEDRDCVIYIEFRGFECDHYFSGMHLCGACFVGFEKELKAMIDNDFDNIDSVLTKEEFKLLFKLNDELKSLGCGIARDSEKYKKGVAILEEYQNTIEKKLLSNENEKLFESIQEEEKEWVKNEYRLSSAEVDEVFNNYGKGYYDLGYRDRAIIGRVFDDFNDMVYEEKWAYGYENQPYFDDNAFGNDLLETGSYLELESGKIVSYNY